MPRATFSFGDYGHTDLESYSGCEPLRIQIKNDMTHIEHELEKVIIKNDLLNISNTIILQLNGIENMENIENIKSKILIKIIIMSEIIHVDFTLQINNMGYLCDILEKSVNLIKLVLEHPIQNKKISDSICLSNIKELYTHVCEKENEDFLYIFNILKSESIETIHLNMYKRDIYQIAMPKKSRNMSTDQRKIHCRDRYIKRYLPFIKNLLNYLTDFEIKKK